MRTQKQLLTVLLILFATASCRQDLLTGNNSLCSLNLRITNNAQSARVIHEKSDSITVSVEYEGSQNSETASLGTGEASITLEDLPVGKATVKITTHGGEELSSLPLSGCEETVVLQEGENHLSFTLSNLNYNVSGIIQGTDSLPLSEQQITLSDDNPETENTLLVSGTDGVIQFTLDTTDLDSSVHFSWMEFSISKSKKDLILNRENLVLNLESSTEPEPPVPGSLDIPVLSSIQTSASGTVALDWNPVTDAESYLVKYNTINDPDSAVAVTALMDPDMTDTTASVTGLTDGTLYFFWVSAHNSQAQSSPDSLTARMVPLDGTGTDHTGADWTPSGTLSGVHYNIGTFSVPAGTTITGSFSVYAETIEIEGTVDATAYGHSGGSAGGPGAGGTGNTGSHIHGGGGGGGGGGIQAAAALPEPGRPVREQEPAAAQAGPGEMPDRTMTEEEVMDPPAAAAIQGYQQHTYPSEDLQMN